jgi:hypothetical protein
MHYHGIFSPPVSVILRVHVSADMKPRLISKQNECEVDFNSIYPLKMQVHKIQVWFKICLLESVSHSYLIWTQMCQCRCISWPWHFLLCKSNQRFSSLCPQSNFLQYLLNSSAYIFCMISCCLKWNLVFKTFPHNHELFSCMELMYQENSVCTVHHLLQQAYFVHTSHKNLHSYWIWVTKTLQSLQQAVWEWASKYVWCIELVTQWKVARKLCQWK